MVINVCTRSELIYSFAASCEVISVSSLRWTVVRTGLDASRINHMINPPRQRRSYSPAPAHSGTRWGSDWNTVVLYFLFCHLWSSWRVDGGVRDRVGGHWEMKLELQLCTLGFLHRVADNPKLFWMSSLNPPLLASVAINKRWQYFYFNRAHHLPSISIANNNIFILHLFQNNFPFLSSIIIFLFQ